MVDAYKLAQQLANILAPTSPRPRRTRVKICNVPQQLAEEVAAALLSEGQARHRPKRATASWQRLRKRGDPQWYQAYLRSRHWRRFRKQVIADARYQCERCGRVDPHQDKKKGLRLNVHHKTYDRVGAEHKSDVEALCWVCHKVEHQGK